MIRIAQMIVVALALVLLVSRLFIRGGEVGFVSGFVTFAMAWWILLFLTLPLRVRGQFEDGAVARGTEPGAPVDPGLKYKAWLTTVITAVFWLIYFALVEYAGLTFETIPMLDRVVPGW